MTSKITKNLTVSRETIERLELFQHQLIKWNNSINLVSQSTIDQFWDRHVVDSAQIYAHAPRDAGKWVDLGSGGGLPGLVVSIIRMEKNSEAKTVLIESDRRKASFLLQMKVLLGLNVDVISKRILDVDPQNGDIVSARALAPLADLLNFMAAHGHDQSYGLFLKGKSFEVEIQEAKRRWAFDFETCTSETDIEAKIIKVTNLKND